VTLCHEALWLSECQSEAVPKTVRTFPSDVFGQHEAYRFIRTFFAEGTFWRLRAASLIRARRGPQSDHVERQKPGSQARQLPRSERCSLILGEIVEAPTQSHYHGKRHASCPQRRLPLHHAILSAPARVPIRPPTSSAALRAAHAFSCRPHCWKARAVSISRPCLPNDCNRAEVDPAGDLGGGADVRRALRRC
jgi:hypothetical protein